MTNIGKEAILKWVLYILYLVWFCWKNNKEEDKNIKALINLSSNINIMYSIYNTKLGFYAKKVDRSYLDIFGMVITDCLVKDKLRKVWFF